MSGTYPIGFFHVDIAEVVTAQGKLYLFVAIGSTWPRWPPKPVRLRLIRDGSAPS